MICDFWVGTWEGRAQVAEPDSVEALFRDLVESRGDQRAAVIQALAKTGDPRVGRVFELFRLGSLNLISDEIVYYEETEEDDDFNEFAILLDPLSGQALVDQHEVQRKVPVDDLEEVPANRQERILIRSAGFPIETWPSVLRP